ncbi:hypothetical protein [Synechococcus phage S-H9-2]|uniref:Uncharacterized protein n=1 Tax=Synechococcus phage S-H9-2 TaxID=2783669 RepID=A0A873WB19_9CAUD|nr:hypothetical protein PQC10_gp153 [Synechococcus phage S-H9-2]QPB08437.1 hypothetical protein [Synechococcus phage S-H9-2]
MKFNLPAPASVEWYRSGVPGGGQKDAIFNRVKAKLIGGKDDSGTSYFKLHDRQLSSSDADKIIANMKQDEDGYPMLQTGSTSGEAEREYQEWLIDRYLVSPPPSNTTTEDPGPKDVAVELQVVEIPAPPPESDKPEPLRVTVEAPFVAKKYIKLPRRRSGGIIYRGATKEVDTQEKVSTAQRMGEAFESNLLGPLIKSIQDPDEDTTPAKKREVVRTLVSRKQRASAITVEKTPQGDTLAEFLGAKVGQSFKMAAQARRADKGLAKKPMFYLGKALTNQFGGDLVNRTKGYFSANPDDTQDPALSRSQRFAASIKPYMNEQGPLPPPVQGPQRSGIPGAFDKVAAKLDELIALKKKKAEQSKVANEIQQIEVKEATEEIKESNELKKKSVEIQKDFIAFTNEQKGDAELLEVEDTAEERDPMADTAEVDNRRDDEEDEDDDDDGDDRGNDRSMLDRALDFVTGDDFLLDAGAEGAERAASRIGRRGARRAGTRLALRLGGRRLAQSAAVRTTQAVVSRVATGISSRAVIGFLRPIFKRIPIVGGLIDFVVSLAMGEPVGRAAAKAIGATLGAALGSLIPIPGVGTIAGGIVGDLVGGAIYDAVTGGVGSAPKSATVEADDTKREALKEAPSTEDMSAGDREALVQGSRLEDAGGSGSVENLPNDLNDPLGLHGPTKFASGGIMTGEAGPESHFSLSSTEGRKVVDEVSSVQNTALSSMPFILGIVSQITETLSGPVKPYIQQEIGTLERLFGIANFNVSQVVGKGVDAVKSVGQKVGINIPGTGSGGGGSGGASAQSSMTSNAPAVNPYRGGPVSGKWGPLLSLIASKESGGNYEAMYPGTTLPGATGMTISEVARTATGAVGMYQQLPEYLVGRARSAGLDPDTDLYSPANQDLIASKVNIPGRGGDDWLAGKLSTEAFMNNLAYEWAALPKADGSFAYPGQSSSITPADVRGSLEAVKAGGSPTAPTAPPPSAPPSSPSNTESTGAEDGPINPQVPPAGGGGSLSLDQIQAATRALGGNPDAPLDIPTITAPSMPANLAKMEANDRFDAIKIQPIIYSGETVPIGYQKSVDTGEGIAKFYYDRSGRQTTLANLKAARLQTN